MQKVHCLPLGLWAEQPPARALWKTVAKRAYIARQMRGYDFLLRHRRTRRKDIRHRLGQTFL